MFSYEAAIFGGLLYSLVLTAHTNAFDVTDKRVEHITLTDKDIVSKEQLDLKLKNGKRDYKFIGDLEIGDRHADETVFRRSVEISNPTDEVYNTAITLNVERGTIHYLSVSNERNSYAVACDEPYSLGTSRTSFNVRVPPNTQSQLWLLVAAH
ncbi:PREDICTED: uncharacterized protein LOC105363837 [Ceratosolen solmsi marchali]|uniref:Uncharacterized protein LOC105363837 n=1 Tax=Ceratosolen solmsi marchali TaxID=326594 RepID=A0AAJ6YKW2_9HYME|nr:PREDICTED: uncharacterized protein LOC105363837 [Ceratosolen solmsi marchali]